MTSDGLGRLPEYQFFRVGTQFSCEVKIPTCDTTFGSKTQGFRSQKLAQQNASKQAVRWLIENGHLKEDGHPACKNRRSEHHPATLQKPTAVVVEVMSSPTTVTTFGKQVNGHFVPFREIRRC
jgi:hypothetical protein